MELKTEQKTSREEFVTTYMLGEAAFERINLFAGWMVSILTIMTIGLAVACVILWQKDILGFQLIILPLLFLFPIWRFVGPDIRHRLARRRGTKTKLKVDNQGIWTNGERRWKYQDLSFCHPQDRSTYFELESEDKEIVFFIYGNSMISGTRFEALKKKLTENLNIKNPKALQQ